MDQPDLQARFLGAMLGLAVGDAIGELAFSPKRQDEAHLRDYVAQTDLLVYTDDTAMAIGLAESIVQAGRLDEQHLGDTFQANYSREPWRGYGPGPPAIFRTIEQSGLSYAEVATRLYGGQGSFGNGAAMRVAPAGLFFHDAPDLYEQARLSACVTHSHPVGVDGAAILACAVAQAVGLDLQAPFPDEPFVQRLADFARTPVFRDKIALIRTLIAKDVPPAQASVHLGRSIAAHESVPFAIYSFVRYPASYEACLKCAVLNGGDRDTLGAMAGGLSGAYLGYDAIPEAWRQKLENRPYIEDLALRLLERRMRRD